MVHSFLHPNRPGAAPRSSTRGLRGVLAYHTDDLHGRALRLCRDATWARDLVQDTLERALRFEAQYAPETNLRAWLHRIQLSLFLTQCRRRRRERRACERLRDDPCAWTAPDALSGWQTLSTPAARALASLPPTFREVVQLIDVGELSYLDAAAMIGVPVGTVMSRLHRGRRLLAERWALNGSGHAPSERAA